MTSPSRDMELISSHSSRHMEASTRFTASGSRAAMAKVDEFSFVSRTLNSDNITNTLTFTGTLLNNYPGTGKTDQIGFGYCDVHPNKTLGGSIAYNPYQTFTSSSDYDTKVAGTSGGDPIDIAWAVKPDGTPAGLSKIQYVRIYTGMAKIPFICAMPV